MSVCCAGSLEYVAASICRMSDSRASEFARIVPSRLEVALNNAIAQIAALRPVLQ